MTSDSEVPALQAGFGEAYSALAGTLTQYPYNDVVLIEISRGWATGFAIGPHTILTAAHVVRDGVLNVTEKDFCVFPGYTGSATSSAPAWGSAGSVTLSASNCTVHYNASWTENFNYTMFADQSQYDFAIIDTDAITFSTWFDIGDLSSVSRLTVNVTGYPAHDAYGNGQYYGGYQTTVYGVTATPEFYDTFRMPGLTTFPGDSGGPLWSGQLDGNGRYVATGIVSAGSPSLDRAVHLTIADVVMIDGWMKGDGYGPISRIPPTITVTPYIHVRKNLYLSFSQLCSFLNPSGDDVKIAALKNDGGGSGSLSDWREAKPNGQWLNVADSSGIFYQPGNISGIDMVEVAIYDATTDKYYYQSEKVGIVKDSVPCDFRGDGASSILFRNDSTGDVGYYHLNGDGSFSSWTAVGGSSTAYTIAGVGDFNRDGVSDILWRDNLTGDVGFYQMNSWGSLAGWRHIGGSSAAYSVVGVGDFNGDGASDILFRNNANGDIGYYAMASGGTLENWHHIGGSSTAYSVAGVGDFNGDGVSDILFRNNANGDTGFYEMANGGAFKGWRHIGGSSTAYGVAGVGDFNGDGVSDILFRNNATGELGSYQMDYGGVLQSWFAIRGSSTDYAVVGVGNYNDDAYSDILFRNNATGEVGYDKMYVGVNVGWHVIAGSSTDYHVAS